MATNITRDGKTITYDNAGSAISSGDVVVIGNSIGIAITDIAATTGTGAVQIEGVATVAAENDAAFSQGDELFWDTSAKEATKTANANTVSAGMCFAAKASSATTVQVKLIGSSSSVPRAAAVTALIDNSGGSAADGTIAVVTAPGAAAAATAVTSAALTSPAAGTGSGADGTTFSGAECDALRADVAAQKAEQDKLVADHADYITKQAANNTAIAALTDAITELATKQAAIISALKAAGLMDQ